MSVHCHVAFRASVINTIRVCGGKRGGGGAGRREVLVLGRAEDCVTIEQSAPPSIAPTLLPSSRVLAEESRAARFEQRHRTQSAPLPSNRTRNGRKVHSAGGMPVFAVLSTWSSRAYVCDNSSHSATLMSLDSHYFPYSTYHTAYIRTGVCVCLYADIFIYYTIIEHARAKLGIASYANTTRFPS